MINGSFTTKPDTYNYFMLVDGTADVFVRIFDHEESMDDGSVQYIYKCNSFKVNSTEITEEMIAADPEKWLDYKPTVFPEISELERIQALEAAMLDLMGVSYE